MRELDHNAHSVFLLYYHLILVVKYRRDVFDDTVSDRAKEIFSYIAPRYGIEVDEWNHDGDHIHVMFNHHYCISALGQAMNDLDELVYISKMKSRSRLIQNIDRISRTAPA